VLVACLVFKTDPTPKTLLLIELTRYAGDGGFVLHDIWEVENGETKVIPFVKNTTTG
jgi:hypothetical protein